MAQAQSPEEIEQGHADFLWEQIQLDAAGILPPEHRAKLDELVPGWNDQAYVEQQRALREQAKRCRTRR